MKKRFARLFIELTNSCGLACSFCTPHGRPPQELPLPTLRRALTEVAELTDTVVFHVLGEALRATHLVLALDEAVRLELGVWITTSGFYMTPRHRALLLHPALRQVNISLHAYGANTTTLSLEGYLQPIVTFIAEASSARPDLYINLRLWREEDHLLIDTLARLLDLSSDALRIPPGRKSRRLVDRLYLHRDAPFAWPTLDGPDYGTTGRCLGTIDHLAILADGTVTACCLDAEGILALGSLEAAPLTALADTPRAVAIREGFEHKKIVEELCRHCGYRTRFN